MQHFPLVDILHTDILEKKYGKIRTKILVHNSTIRKSHLITKNGRSLTFAITFFSKKDKKFIQINKEIKAGTPIGKAFINHKYKIRKNVIDVYTISIPTWLQEEFRTKEVKAKVRLSEFYAKKGTTIKIYGTVAEIYSPKFRKAFINATDKAQIGSPTKELEKLKITKTQIWTGIEKGWKKDLPNANLKKIKERITKELLLH